MALFQQSVLTKYIKSVDEKLLETKWNEFTKIFHNAEKQTNIRNSKEEQYQEGFLRDLFVQIFGYTINPETNYNLLTEQKNVSNAKKADGAILIDGKVKAVIELKGTDTTDLSKIETQAFGYKNNQPECVYVITSNFEKLRFYIENSVDFIEFNLFNLTKEEFKILFVCLAFENIKANVPKHLKDESVSNENKITKQLYKDYSDFKRALFNNLVERNLEIDKLLLFKKTQKLLDRFLFIFFAEDRHLVPTNLIRRINLEWENLQKMRIPVSLYERYKMYFEDLNSGAKVTLPAFGKKTGDAITAEFEIFAYNGGLFAEDELLDNVQIDDDILYKHTILLSDYDFESDVDVNILGHIFENSLNEIDEIKSEIEGKEVDKTKTKRKKDGVFYTPKYITKYIVDNTVGKLCEEKKAEFGIIDEEFAKGRKNRNKTTIEKLDKQLHNYRDWLLQITICDPACGSGAFLNQALEFLIQEHKYIDNLEAQLLGNAIGFPGAELHILENNIYGVDLNDESVEIAKLSLWLRTAQKGRKLNSLNNNIKCGNSLIDDPEIAGEKAFSWEKEFPEVFAPSTGSGGGFDVIIGNPPYAYRNSIEDNLKQFYNRNYESNEGNYELYKFFIEKSLSLFNDNGYFSFITSSSFLIQNSFTKLRKLILTKSNIIELVPLGPNVFEDATVDSSIFIITKTKKSDYINIKTPSTSINLSETIPSKIKADRYLRNKDYVFDCQLNEDMYLLLDKIYEKSTKIKELFDIGVGINTGYIRDELVQSYKVDERFHKMVPGSGISRYGACLSSEWIMYDKDFVRSKGKLGRTLPEKRFFDNDKILVVRTRNLSMKRRIIATFDFDKKYNLNRLSNIIAKNNNSLYGLVAFLNSNFYNWLFSTKYLDYEIKPIYLKECPIIESGLNILEERSKFIYEKNIILIDFTSKFTTYFSSQYNLEKLSGKLEKWYELSFVDFIKELNKAIKAVKGTPLTKKDEFEWMDLFEENKKKALEIKAEIDKTDKEIDQMVYELYGLTEEEIKIVEGV